jgi:hypothetical protein
MLQLRLLAAEEEEGDEEEKEEAKENGDNAEAMAIPEDPNPRTATPKEAPAPAEKQRREATDKPKEKGQRKGVTITVGDTAGPGVETTAMERVWTDARLKAVDPLPLGAGLHLPRKEYSVRVPSSLSLPSL